jgi:hypothetical protein
VIKGPTAAMLDLGCDLRRIHLSRTRVNRSKGRKGQGVMPGPSTMLADYYYYYYYYYYYCRLLAHRE